MEGKEDDILETMLDEPEESVSQEIEEKESEVEETGIPTKTSIGNKEKQVEITEQEETKMDTNIESEILGEKEEIVEEDTRGYKRKSNTWKFVAIGTLVVLSSLFVGNEVLKSNGYYTELRFKDTMFEYAENVDMNKLLKNKDCKITKHNLNTKRLGKQAVTMEVQQGKYSFEKTHNFTIVDTTKPVIELEKDIIEVTEGEEIQVEELLQKNIKKVTDNVDKDLKPEINGKVNMKKPGDYKIKVNVTDKQKNKAEKEFTVTVKKKEMERNRNKIGVPSKTPSFKPAPVVSGGYSKTHSILVSEIKQYDPVNSLCYQFIDRIKAGVNDFAGPDNDAITIALNDLIWNYAGYREGTVFHYSQKDENGNYHVRISDEIWQPIYEKVCAGGETFVDPYNQYLENVLRGMNLNTSDVNLANQINRFICNNFSYKITNGTDMSFIETGVGQCHHYAVLFSDLCNGVGIPCEYVTGYANGGYHAWNRVLCDGTWYYIDVTWNDSTGTNNYGLTPSLWPDHVLE